MVEHEAGSVSEEAPSKGRRSFSLPTSETRTRDESDETR